MKGVRFNKDKNELLKIQRGIDFEDISEFIRKNRRIKTINHPNKKRYPKQKILLVKMGKHIYAVPFVEENEYIFLKTIYPSEKYTRKLLKIK